MRTNALNNMLKIVQPLSSRTGTRRPHHSEEHRCHLLAAAFGTHWAVDCGVTTFFSLEGTDTEGK